MTIEQFKEKKIKPLYIKEKGLNKIDKNYFKKDNKIIRNLSQISYRLLNYILYCHLFFAKLYTNSEKFDSYLPEGMKWINMLKECFILLKKELEKKGIKEIEIFMNCIFKDLFEKLHEQECINDYETLIKFENELDTLIQGKFGKVKEEIEKYKEFERKKYKEFERNCIKDEKSAIALLKEIYNKDKYDNREYPYYEHFYYTDYIDEEYIDNILEHKNKNDYPVLSKYLEHKKQKNKDKYSLDNLILFNKVLKLFNDKYSNQISRESSEKQTIKNSEIYQEMENANLIEDFIKLYKSFNLEDDKHNKLELDADKNCICDFLLIDDNKYGKSYNKIYKIFIDRQNTELENLLDNKIEAGEFNNNCKNRINIQQMKEDEIFTLPKKFDFNNVIFNSSYRKVIDTKNYENYNEYEISLKKAEAEMTDSLLKNKKLLNDVLIGFTYNNEVFKYEINDLISNFKYGKVNMTIDDKLEIYQFINKNDGNNEKYRNIINNFITLIEYLNKMHKEQNDKINEKTKIFEIVENSKNLPEEFKNIFKNKNDLTVNKITNIFDYYLMLIFKYVKKDIEKYQVKAEVNKNENEIKNEIKSDKKENKKEKNEEEKPKYYLDKAIIEKLNEIYKNGMIITKDTLASAIRIFISLVLYREEEKNKDRKIKLNRKNIIEYLKIRDLWELKIYKDEKFEDNLTKIKELNIKINEILCFYYYLTDNKDEGFEIEVKEELRRKEEEEKRKEEEKKQMQEDIVEKGGEGGEKREGEIEEGEGEGEEEEEEEIEEVEDEEKAKRDRRRRD